MGTRSITRVFNEKMEEIGVMYRQYDGYPTGHGRDLFDAFGQFEIINGYGMGDNSNKANGMGCLFAQIIAHFKEGIGNIYLYPPGTKDIWEEYSYTLYLQEGKLYLQVDEVGDPGRILFIRPLSTFGEWLEEYGDG